MRGGLYAGLDVGSISCHCAAVDAGGQRVKDQRRKRRPLTVNQFPMMPVGRSLHRGHTVAGAA